MAHLFKTQYTALILYVISVCLAKLSVVVTIAYITPNPKDQRILWVIGIIISVWTFIAFWVSAFQCHTPHTWDFYSENCINRVSAGPPSPAITKDLSPML